MAVKINNISYSGFFYNGEALTAMYLNGNKVYGSESQPITITPVEWISNENINTRIWLDLGYVWKNNSRAQLGFVIPGTHQKPNGQQVFGEDTVWASDGNGPVDDNNDLRLFFTKSSSNIGAYWDVATSRVQATIGAITDVWQHWEIGNNYIKNLSNNTNFVTGSTYNISRTGNVGLYGACQYLNTGRTDCVRYSYVKIYEGDTLVKDIIPVLDMNNIPCFFDKVGEHFYYYKVNGVPSTGLTYGNTVTVYDWVSNGGVTSSSNRARINIDYFWKTNSRAELTFKVLRASSGFIFADDGGSTPVRLSSVKNSLLFQYHRATVTANRDWSNIQNIEMGNFYLKDLDTDTVIVTGTTQTGDQTATMYLWDTMDTSQIYSIKIYEGDTLVRDLIPALLSDNRKGLWDKQRNLFYGDVYNHTDSLFLGDNGQTLVIPVI